MIVKSTISRNFSKEETYNNHFDRLIKPLTKLVKKQLHTFSEVLFSEHLGNEANGQAFRDKLKWEKDIQSKTKMGKMMFSRF